MTGPRLRVGLLQCGSVHPALVGDHGDYPALFERLLGPHGVHLTTYDVRRDLPPDDARSHDGWLVSGSADSTYDPLGWIGPVEGFLRDLVEGAAPLVAICFGHQLLAQAHGGRVARADAGWGVGIHRYELLGPAPPWGLPSPDGTFGLVASHQDQVVDLPDGAVTLARSPHCPVAAFTLGPAALAVQAHPEFTAALSRDLIEVRRDRIGEQVADHALAGLDGRLDQEAVGRWMVGFWHHAAVAAAT